jgi:DNA ligase 1
MPSNPHAPTPPGPSALFARFAALCEQLAATSSRLERARLIADYLRTLTATDVESATRLLVGRAFPETEGRRLSLGGSAVWQALEAIGTATHRGAWAGVADFGELVRQVMPEPPADSVPLTFDDVRTAFAAIATAAGSGSRRQRIAQLAALFRRATGLEAKYLAKIVIGEMRHGVQEGIVLEALARLSGLPPRAIRRANQSLGDVGRLAALAVTDPARLDHTTTQLFRPIKPMLAQTAASVAAAVAAMQGRLALEWKLDGARVQIHRRGNEVRIFSRRLQDISRSLPDIVALVNDAGSADAAIFEGEVIAVRDGRPLPFQDLMRRFRRVRDIAAIADQIPVELYLFDLLYLDTRALLDEPAWVRWDMLQTARGALRAVNRLLPPNIDAGQAFFDAALGAGHEGVMAKALDAPYTPGVRGAGWLKIKHSVTLDLVIVAADWGYGRRHGWLSNYHLAVRDPASGSFLPVGKTFKGPTDAEFQILTQRLLALREREAHGTVTVRPEVVVEVRFDGIQRSPQYDAGLALRFARIVRVRDDKTAEEADSIDTLRTLFQQRGAPEGAVDIDARNP